MTLHPVAPSFPNQPLCGENDVTVFSAKACEPHHSLFSDLDGFVPSGNQDHEGRDGHGRENRKENKMTKEAKTQPVETMRDGALKAAFWKNESENGPFFTVTFERTYRDGEEVKSASGFSGTQLLQLSHLAEKAYDRARKLTAAARVTKEDGDEA